MIEESKYCTGMMQKHFHKELVMTKKDNEDFKNSTKCWICDHIYVEGNVKVTDHFHIIGKYKRYAHRACNINVELNYKISTVFHNLNIFLKLWNIFQMKTSKDYHDLYNQNILFT